MNVDIGAGIVNYRLSQLNRFACGVTQEHLPKVRQQSFTVLIAIVAPVTRDLFFKVVPEDAVRILMFWKVIGVAMPFSNCQLTAL